MASNVVENGVKLVGEGLLPGTSQLIDGEIKSGLGYAAVGILAAAVFGPLGWVAVAGDSYSRSVTGKGLWEHLSPSKPAAEKAK
jgi:hypothetical protein